MGLRERNRRNTLRATQRAAVAMFAARGFDAVKVTEIAAEVGMAASSLYRHFTTKELLVLWDEHDDAFEAALAETVGQRPAFSALKAAFVAGVGERYDVDANFQLERVRLIYETPSVYAAAAEENRRAREGLVELLTPQLPRKHRASAPSIAAAALLAVDLAFEQWLSIRAAKPLATLVGRSFDVLGTLGDLS